MQRANEIHQQYHEHCQAKDRSTIDLCGPTRRPITPDLVFAADGKPSTRLPPGELAEQLGTPNNREPNKGQSEGKPRRLQKIIILSDVASKTNKKLKRL